MAPLSGSTDVAVIGGSLAGSAAAAALANAGAGVTVLERARFPRAKLCGEFLSHEALPLLERLGVLDGLLAAGAETIDRFALIRPDGRRVEAPLPAPVLSVSRELLDTAVARAAEGLGACYRFGVTVTAIEGDLASGFRVTGPGLDLRARVVLGAWGRYSPLDGRLGRPFFGSPAPLFGFGTHLAGDTARFHGRIHLHPFDGGYLGLARVEGGLLNLAALARPDVATAAHHDLGELLARLRSGNAALGADLDGLTPLPGRVLLSEPVHLGVRESVLGDVLLAGDAAGVLDPWTGTGMSTALATGDAAAGPILDFLAGRSSAADLRRAHAAAHARILGRRFLWSRLFRPFFTSGIAARLLVPGAAPLARLAARLTRGPTSSS